MADTNDVVTLAEAKTALKISNTNSDPLLATYITAVSNLLDDQCGPIVTRTYSTERHVGGRSMFEVRHWPIATVTAFTNWSGTTGSTWTEITPGTVGVGYVLEPRQTGTGTYTGTIATSDGSAFGDWVTLSYTAGRSADTTNAGARFKQAAYLMLDNLWRANTISIEQVGDFEVASPTFPASYAIPNSVRDVLGDDWRGERNKTMSAVMFG